VKQGIRYAVFSIRTHKNGSTWVRAGYAFVNKDDSMNLYLDVLPIDGTLHVREPGEKRDRASEPRNEALNEQDATRSH
jgi:hypothetical protein